MDGVPRKRRGCTRRKLKPNILFEFYRMEMTNETPMYHICAAPEKDKVKTVVQEFIRRIKALQSRSSQRELKKCSQTMLDI